MIAHFVRFPLLAVLACGIAMGQEPGLTPHTSTAHPILAIGSPAPDFALPGIDGQIHKLSDYKDSPLLVVMFICNHCPTSQLYEGRIKKLVEDYRGKGVAFVAIQPNDPKAVQLSELGYTDVSDSLDEMKIRAEYRHFNFPYLYDGETQAVTQAYGAQATPHVFIFDRERKLRYEGRIDNAQRESLVKIQDARAALDALLAGKPVAVPHTPAFGCSTKWKSKIDSQHGGDEEDRSRAGHRGDGDRGRSEEAAPESHRQGAADQLLGHLVRPLRQRVSRRSKTTFRMFRRRDFDLVTVSTNYPDEKAGVMKILQEQHASSRNLQFGTDDTYALAGRLRRPLGRGRAVHHGDRTGRQGALPGAGGSRHPGHAPRHPGESGERDVRRPSSLLGEVASNTGKVYAGFPEVLLRESFRLARWNIGPKDAGRLRVAEERVRTALRRHSEKGSAV